MGGWITPWLVEWQLFEWNICLLLKLDFRHLFVKLKNLFKVFRCVSISISATFTDRQTIRQTNRLTDTLLCITLYDFVLLCMAMYDYLWLCLTMFDNVRQLKLLHLIQMFSHSLYFSTNLDFVYLSFSCLPLLKWRINAQFCACFYHGRVLEKLSVLKTMY